MDHIFIFKESPFIIVSFKRRNFPWFLYLSIHNKKLPFICFPSPDVKIKIVIARLFRWKNYAAITSKIPEWWKFILIFHHATLINLILNFFPLLQNLFFYYFLTAISYFIFFSQIFFLLLLIEINFTFFIIIFTMLNFSSESEATFPLHLILPWNFLVHKWNWESFSSQTNVS